MKAFLMMFLLMLSMPLMAGETITAGDMLAADKVLSRQDKIKNVAAAVGGTFGALSGYASATAAGLTGAAVILPTISGALIGAGYMYGAGALGERLGIHFGARSIRRDLESAGLYLERKGMELQQ